MHSQPATKPAAEGCSRKRLPREVRERLIIEQATELFAERGFGVTTRELASAMGVTQALLYQYFASKEALIERVFEETFFAPWDTSITQQLADERHSLEDRLTTFYETFVIERLTAHRQRLFLRANLDGLDLARRFSMPLNKRVLEPVLSALRREKNLPGLDVVPMSSDERELVLMLHGGIVFLGLRKHVYGVTSIGRLDRRVRSHVRMFLDGALNEIGQA